ncbi:patatin family protein [Cavenderia fasciculata]|uniref:Patatin family protein n=1 Tax=Cavenderia fasciculata TaxID=261658 RepID=F4QBF4_CACFS|nr:patatin family protein [Cavenderia fasciculata]EGG14926.1 patatin family protein [Cavenderia fasciculata]|eukprot:XP_004351442.1 patatin family protein [Cavenderia fasciculata]
MSQGSYCVLSLDGGGVRGIIETAILSRIIMVYPNFLDSVDLITGASAGGILALVLASGKSNIEAQDFFKKLAPAIFHKSWFHEITSLDSCIAPAYTNAKLKEVLAQEFGDLRLKDLPKKVLIPSFQLDNHSTAHIPEEDKVKNADGSGVYEDDDDDFEIIPHHVPPRKQQQHRRWAPRFFHNLHHSKTKNHKCVDVGLRTSAAPTYFPIYQGFVDGGVYANNPSLCAVTSAISSGVPLDSIVVLSLSTGRDGMFVSPEQYGAGDWGLAQWAPTLINMLLDSNVEISDFQCAQLLGGHYHRVDPLLPKVIDLDQPNFIPLLEEIANNVDITDTLNWIKQYWFNEKPQVNFTKTPTTSPSLYANKKECCQHHQQQSVPPTIKPQFQTTNDEGKQVGQEEEMEEKEQTEKQIEQDETITSQLSCISSTMEVIDNYQESVQPEAAETVSTTQESSTNTTPTNSNNNSATYYGGADRRYCTIQ